MRHFRARWLVDGTTIRALDADDPPVIAAAFAAIGWDKPESQYRRYLDEQTIDVRRCWVALRDGAFAGYVTLLWRPEYGPFREAGIPEIQDLNVLPQFRRLRVASVLVERAERAAAERADEVGIGVDYIPATTQRSGCMSGAVTCLTGVA